MGSVLFRWTPFFFLAICTVGAQTHASDDLDSIARSDAWRALLHYRKNFLGIDRSEQDGDSFFIAGQAGKSDPLAELGATIQAMRNDTQPTAKRFGPIAQPAQCAFAARRQFLQNQGIDLGPAVVCSDLDQWKRGLHAQSLVLIYAAPYLGSPASMFGHTFLKLKSGRSELLDYGFSFEAVTGDVGAMGYAIQGLLGMFPGKFSQMPFYLKVNQYSNLESRDLWEYSLNLTAAELDFLLSHLWEMGLAHFDYYFFDENCSYHLLRLIEAVRPSAHLGDRFSWMAIPADTVRELMDHGFVQGRPTLRASLTTRLQGRLDQMTETERALFSTQVHWNKNTVVPKDASARVLDAWMDLAQYQAMSAGEKLNDPHAQVNPELLRRRALLKDSEPLVLPERQPPEMGHLSSKISIFSGFARSTQTLREVGFGLRPAVHDTMDPDAGYLAHSELTIGETELGVVLGHSSHLHLRKFTAAQVKTISPSNAWNRPWSWSVGGGYVRLEDCLDCGAGRFQAALGKAVSLGRVLGWSLLRGQLEAGTQFKNFLRVGPEVELGLQVDFGKGFRFENLVLPRMYFLDGDFMWPSATDRAILAYSIGRFDFRVEGGATWILNRDDLKSVFFRLGYFY